MPDSPENSLKVVGYKKGEPFDLIVAPIGLGFYLEVQAAQHFLDMAAAAKKDGIVFVVNTAYRTNAHQELLRKRYDAYLEALKEGKAATPVAAASKPGYSTHQSGVSVDINRAQGDNPKTKTPDSPVDLWLRAHAAEYGFYNDVATEPWHWTFYSDRLKQVVANAQ